jgi:hypothetical protein
MVGQTIFLPLIFFKFLAEILSKNHEIEVPQTSEKDK